MKFGIVSTGGHIWKLAEDLCGPKNADQSFTVPQQIGLNEKVALLPAPRLRGEPKTLGSIPIHVDGDSIGTFRTYSEGEKSQRCRDFFCIDWRRDLDCVLGEGVQFQVSPVDVPSATLQ